MAGKRNKPNTAAKSNESRRSGKAWKVRPCGQRHGMTECKPCAAKAAAEKVAAFKRSRTRILKAAEKAGSKS